MTCPSLKCERGRCFRSSARPPRGLCGSVRQLPHVSVQCRAQTAETASNVATPSAAPSPSRPNLVSVLRDRGLIQETTNDERLEALVSSNSIAVYCGFDPTADSLHLGNLLGIIVLTWCQRLGHQPVALLGGATGRVGDPSGRSTERPVLSEEQIEHNVAAIGKLLRDILGRAGCSSAAATAPAVKILNNLDWFGPMAFLTFLREVGKFARVGTMLAKDSVRSRMESESGISFTEFTYQLLQGYDYVHLAREHGVRLQVGGSDQWGNITAGTDLIRRLLGGGGGGGGGGEAPDCFGLTFPLLVDSEGRKFGKSVGGAIWLSAEKLSPYKFYQYLFAVADADVIKMLRMLTFAPLAEISELEAAMAAPGYLPNTAQRRLAEEVTRFVHGEEGLQQALKVTEALRPGSKTELDVATLQAVAGDAPTVSVPLPELLGRPLSELLVAVKLQPSKSQARKLIKSGAVYVNNVKIADEAAVVADKDLIGGQLMLLAAGKKNKMLIQVTA